MKKLRLTLVFFVATLIFTSQSVVAQQDQRGATTQPPKTFTVDSRVLDLLDNPRTRPVIERHLPNLAERLQEDFELARYFYDATLRDLALDDDHVIGFDEELLNKLAADLLAVQSQG